MSAEDLIVIKVLGRSTWQAMSKAYELVSDSPKRTIVRVPETPYRFTNFQFQCIQLAKGDQNVSLGGMFPYASISWQQAVLFLEHQISLGRTDECYFKQWSRPWPRP